MRFGNASGPPPWLNRRDQMRMLVLVGLLAVVLVTIQVASRPGTWGWLFRDHSRTDSTPASRQIEAQPAQQARASLRDDEILVEPRNVETDNSADRGTAVGQTAAPSTPGSSDVAVGRELPHSGGEPSSLRIPSDVLEEVRDDYVGLRASEADAYHLTLARARQIAPGRMKAAAAERVDFALLMDAPDQFRGRPIIIEGRLRGLTPVPAGENRFGITTVYDAWIFPPEAGNNPYCVRCLEIDEALPLESPIENVIPVRAVGFFFKRFGYAAAGAGGSGNDFHVAPMLLARRLERIERSTSPAPRDRGLTPWLIGLAATIGVLLAIAVVWFRISDRRFESSHLKRLTAAPRDAIDSLEGVETTDPAEMFRRMSQEARAGDHSD